MISGIRSALWKISGRVGKGFSQAVLDWSGPCIVISFRKRLPEKLQQRIYAQRIRSGRTWIDEPGAVFLSIAMEWLQPYVNRLHVISPVFAHEPLPDFWLDASVTVWK